MKENLKLYHEFIDDLVKINEGVLGTWVMERGWPKLPENDDINKLLKKLSKNEKQAVRKIVEQSRLGGIHDTLVYLSELGNLRGLRISINGVELAEEPYGTELFWDWTARSQGDHWPESQLNSKYRE